VKKFLLLVAVVAIIALVARQFSNSAE